MLIPIKAFHVAKARMAPVLDEGARERLARWTAERVVRAVTGAPVFVACDDQQVADWATAHNATVLWQPGRGLNPAVDTAVATIRSLGVDHVLIAHSDLPLPQSLTTIARSGTITLVPDRRLDGTNVWSFPLQCDVAASYGPGSFGRHLAAALASGCAVEVVRHPFLALDLDIPSDLLHPLVHPLVKEVLPPWQRTNPVSRFSIPEP